MTLAIFDLDHTLIHADSDYQWLQFLCDQNAMDAHSVEQSNAKFYADYEAGTLDIDAYTQFALSPLVSLPKEKVLSLREQFMAEIIEPVVLPKALDLLEQHRQQGHHLLIISATNAFIVEPIAKRLGVEDFLAVNVEQINGQYTGRSFGVPTFKEGKITRLHEWNAERGYDLNQAYFYSDSANDIPLLQRVGHPVATNPCPRLQQAAQQYGWPCLDLTH